MERKKKEEKTIYKMGFLSFSKTVWFSRKKFKGGEVGPGAPITSKEAQSYSVTTRTFSPTVVPSGKEACDEAAPTTSPAAKEAAETGTLERPGESAQVSHLDKPCVEVVPITSGEPNRSETEAHK